MILGSSLFSRAQAGSFFEAAELDVDYPVAMGTIAQNYSSTVGGDVAIYFDRILDAEVPNYISVGYHSFGILADGKSTFRVIPVLLGVDFVGKAFKDFSTIFGVAVGGAFGYLSVTNATSFNMNGYFAAGIKTGFDWWVGDSIAITGRAPVDFIIGKKLLTYVPFAVGLKLKF